MTSVLAQIEVEFVAVELYSLGDRQHFRSYENDAQTSDIGKETLSGQRISHELYTDNRTIMMHCKSIMYSL